MIETDEAQQAALEAAKNDDQKITAWVSLDVNGMLALSRTQQNDILRQAGANVKRALTKELQLHRQARRAEAAIADRPV